MCTLQRHERYDLSSDVGGVKGVRRVIRTSEDYEKDIQNATNSFSEDREGFLAVFACQKYCWIQTDVPLTRITMQLI